MALTNYGTWESGYIDKINTKASKKLEQATEKVAIAGVKRALRAMKQFNTGNKRVGKLVAMHGGSGMSVMAFVRNQDAVEFMLNIPMSTGYKTYENGRFRYNVHWDGTIHIVECKTVDTVKYNGERRPFKEVRDDVWSKEE